MEAASCSPRSTVIPASTSLAPSAARRREVAAPRPCEAPRTTMTLEANLCMLSTSKNITETVVPGLIRQCFVEKLHSFLVLADHHMAVSPKLQSAGTRRPDGGVLMYRDGRSVGHVAWTGE